MDKNEISSKKERIELNGEDYIVKTLYVEGEEAEGLFYNYTRPVEAILENGDEKIEELDGAYL